MLDLAGAPLPVRSLFHPEGHAAHHRCKDPLWWCIVGWGVVLLANDHVRIRRLFTWRILQPGVELELSRTRHTISLDRGRIQAAQRGLCLQTERSGHRTDVRTAPSRVNRRQSSTFGEMMFGSWCLCAAGLPAIEMAIEQENTSRDDICLHCFICPSRKNAYRDHIWIMLQSVLGGISR